LKEASEGRPARAGVDLAEWRSGLENRSAPARWFLLLRTSAPGSDGNEKHRQHEQDKIQTEVAQIPLPRVRRPWVTYLGGTAVAFCLVVGMIAVPLVNHRQCQSWLSAPDLHADMTREPSDGGDQCVGLLHANAHVPAELTDVIKVINANNKLAEDNPHHLTVIHVPQAVRTACRDEDCGRADRSIRPQPVARADRSQSHEHGACRARATPVRQMRITRSQSVAEFLGTHSLLAVSNDSANIPSLVTMA
jgi:hypothetical protein